MLQLFSFKGYTGRLGYLGVIGAHLLVGLVGIFLSIIAFGGKENPGGMVIFLAGLGASIWIILAGSGRRARDMGWPAWVGWLVGGFAPGGFAIMMMLPSQPRDDELVSKASVFSDDPPTEKRKKNDAQPDWLQRAMAQASSKGPGPAPVQSTPAPQRFVAPQPASGPRTEFGLRRW